MKRPKRIGLLVGAVALTAALLLFLMPAGLDISTSGRVGITLGTYEVSASPEREWIESTWMRTKNSKVFHSYEIPNREYHDIYLDAVHYEVGHEREIETLEGYETIYWTTWEDIDNTLEPAGELSPWDWQMTKADYNIYILEDFTYGQILKFEKADPYGIVLGDIAFQPMALQWTNDPNQIQEVSMPQTGSLSAVDNQIEWNNAYGSNINFSWMCYSTRLVKLLTVQSLGDLPTPEQYILDGSNPVLELNLIFDPSSELDIYADGELWDKKSKIQTFDMIEFRLGTETLWGFMPLQVWDSSSADEITVIQQLRKVGNKLYVSVRIPYEWIENATFPIYIDAVVDEWIETSSDDANEIISDGNINLTDTIIDLGFYTGGPTHAGFRFTGIDTTDVDEVQIAYLEFYPAQSDTGAVGYTWYGEDVASAATFTTNAYDISGRGRTTASVTENSPLGWVNGVPVQTADLSDILNEVFSRGDWVSGNDLAILNIYNSGSGERRLRSWDYNDHSKTPKLHFENPTEVTYYWDVYNPILAWNDESFAWDGNLATFAYTLSDNSVMHGEQTTCPGTILGIISKVEIRCYGYGDGNDRIDLSFPSTEYQLTMPGSEDWSGYADVTGDPDVGGWTWAKVADLQGETGKRLKVEFDKVQSGGTMYCAKVETRVTYDEGGVPDITNAPNTWTLNGIINDGVIVPDTVYYANPQGDTQAPASTVADADCRFTVTNSSTMAIDLTCTMGSFSGGDADMTNSDDGSNGATTYGAYSWFSGQLYANKVIIKITGSSIGYDGLAATTDIKWGAEVETRTNAWTGSTSSTAILTVTATVD